MKDEIRLSFAEFLTLDAMIAVAQERGLSFTDRLDNTQEQAEAQADRVEGMWETRHGGLVFSDHDREIFAQMNELASQLEFAPTLGELVELRAEALRMQFKG